MGPSSPHGKGTAAPTFRPMSTVAKQSPIVATAELLYTISLRQNKQNLAFALGVMKQDPATDLSFTASHAVALGKRKQKQKCKKVTT